MKYVVALGISTVVLCMAPFAYAQGTLYLSNLGESSSVSFSIAADSWYGALFRTGGNAEGYDFNAVQLAMASATGIPSGFTVHIYGYNEVLGEPSMGLETLNGIDPAAGGIFTYTSSGLHLSASTAYFIILTSSIPAAPGAYLWNRADSVTYVSSDGWFMGSGRYDSPDGANWSFVRPAPFQFAINATAVPEPSSTATLLLGALVFATRHVKH